MFKIVQFLQKRSKMYDFEQKTATANAMAV